MSYEGYDEYLCEKGHYYAKDCHHADPERCPICQGKITHWHPVDATNGMTDDPATYPARKKKIGVEDDWREDHYGNNYSLEIPLFEPIQDTGGWREWKPEAA